MKVRVLCNIGSRELRFPHYKEGAIEDVTQPIAEIMIADGLAEAMPESFKAKPDDKPQEKETSPDPKKSKPGV